jgi:hypothetical protein
MKENFGMDFRRLRHRFFALISHPRGDELTWQFVVDCTKVWLEFVRYLIVVLTLYGIAIVSKIHTLSILAYLTLLVFGIHYVALPYSWQTRAYRWSGAARFLVSLGAGTLCLVAMVGFYQVILPTLREWATFQINLAQNHTAIAKSTNWGAGAAVRIPTRVRYQPSPPGPR